jgi:hypothetical protein
MQESRKGLVFTWRDRTAAAAAGMPVLVDMHSLTDGCLTSVQCTPRLHASSVSSRPEVCDWFYAAALMMARLEAMITT